MKATIDGKRYVFVESGLINESMDSFHADKYKCRQCAGDPVKFAHLPGNDKFTLHTKLSNLVPQTPSKRMCNQGFWVRDTKEGRAEAVIFLLELT